MKLEDYKKECLLKMNFEKTCEFVSWGFLLSNKVFHERWVNLIKEHIEQYLF